MSATEDHRGADRFVVVEPLSGSFGSAAVSIRNLAFQGAQIEHAQPLRLATKARLWFKQGAVSASVQGTIVWSHLSRTPNSEGKLLYLSGVRIDEEMTTFRDALETLASQGFLRLDAESLGRKRERAEQQQRERSKKPVVTLLRHESAIPSDQILLIQQARERLRANPDESLKWYNRAKFSVTDKEVLHHREDVLAVWEYLDRSVDLDTIVQVIDSLKNR